MALVSFQVIDGVDKGRAFLNVETPLTIGREEGNAVRLNDDRISRFHAKVQEDQGCVVLTDLDSTNGTRVNGENVQLRLLRTGDRIDLGRSTLLFGSPEDIAEVLKNESNGTRLTTKSATHQSIASPEESGEEFAMDGAGLGEVWWRTPPDLPQRMTPAQAAQLSEVFDFLHRGIADATSSSHIGTGSKEARIPIDHWHRIQAMLAHLATYARKVTEPGSRSGE